MDRLSDLLGPAFKRDDFEIKDGAVASGKPLTQRRITSIVKAAASVNAETSYDPKTNLAKAESIKVQSAPQMIDKEDDIESSVDDDDDEDVSFEYDTPRYAAGLPPETEVAFMEFYCAAVKETVADGRSKEECDDMLQEMFRAVGYDKTTASFWRSCWRAGSRASWTRTDACLSIWKPPGSPRSSSPSWI